MSSGLEFRAFMVTKSLSEDEITLIRQQEEANGADQDVLETLESLVPLDQGWVGYVPGLAANFEHGRLKKYIEVEMYQTERYRGYESRDTKHPDGYAVVPSANIRVGQTRASEASFPVISNVHASASRMHRGTASEAYNTKDAPLRRFLLGFLDSCAEDDNAATLSELSVDERMLGGIRNQRDRQGLVDAYIAGMKNCRTYDLFKNGMPAFKDIWNKCGYIRHPSALNPPHFKSQGGSHLYLQAYYNPQNHDGDDHGLYGGISTDVQSRDMSHEVASNKQDTRIAHYRVSEFLKRVMGAKRRLFPISFLSRNIPNHHIMFAWAETMTIALFSGYSQDMLDLDPNYGSPSFPRTRNSSSLGFSANTTSPSRLGQMAAHSSPLSRFLTQLAWDLKKKHFHTVSLDIKYHGCNWSVPLLEFSGAPDVAPWMERPPLDDNGRARFFSYSTYPRRLSGSRTIQILGSRYGTSPGGLGVRLSEEDFPEIQPGDYINAIIEIAAAPGTKHPHPFVQIPVVGPFDIWNEASRFAVRIEYRDRNTGCWVTVYLQYNNFAIFTVASRRVKSSDITPTSEAQQLNHMEVGWLNCIKAMAALLGWRWNPQGKALNRLIWVPYKAKVRQIYFNWIKQAWIVSSRDRKDVPQPRLLTLEETTDRLQRLYGDEVNLGRVDGPEATWLPDQMNQDRDLCDQCRTTNRPTKSDPGPKLQFHHSRYCNSTKTNVLRDASGNELHQCRVCKALRRVCTYTPSIEKRTKEFPALVYSCRPPFAKTRIPEPENVMAMLERQDRDDKDDPDDTADGGEDQIGRDV